MGCEPDLIPYKDFFAALAYTTGGQYVPLRNARLLSKVIVGGAVEEISLDKLLEDAEKEVENQRAQGITDEKDLAEAVERKFKAEGRSTYQLKLNDSALESASDTVVTYSKFAKMSDLRSEFKKIEPEYPQFTAYAAVEPIEMLSESRVQLLDADNIPMSASAFIEPRYATASLEPQVYEEKYTVEQDTFNYQQSERLVKKILNKRKE